MTRIITGKTILTGLLGSPVSHSMSPIMHNEGFRLLDLDYRYLCFDVDTERLQKVVEGLRAMGVRGWNVTMPCKNLMARLADELSPAARVSGAVNTVVNENGILTGYTTDGIGFMRAAAEAGCDLIGKKMTILGAGGASTSIISQAALDGMEEIRVFNRKSPTFDRALEIASILNETTTCKVTVHDLADRQDLRDCIEDSHILTNATSVGMAPHEDLCILEDDSYLRKDLIVSDVIYSPRETILLKMARQKGCLAFNGLYMLLYQGAAGFELWTGREMPVESIKEKYFTGQEK